MNIIVIFVITLIISIGISIAYGINPQQQVSGERGHDIYKIYPIGSNLPGSISETNTHIPEWIKSTAGWWSNDRVWDSDFIESIHG